MKWLLKLLGIKVTRECNTWPYADKVTVKVLAPVSLMDVYEDHTLLEVAAGTVLSLVRTQNAYGLTDPWMVKTEKKDFGGVERCFRDWVETGKMEVISFSN